MFQAPYNTPSTATAPPSPDKAAAPGSPAASPTRLGSAEGQSRSAWLPPPGHHGPPAQGWLGGGTRVSLPSLELPQTPREGGGGGGCPPNLTSTFGEHRPRTAGRWSLPPRGCSHCHRGPQPCTGSPGAAQGHGEGREGQGGPRAHSLDGCTAPCRALPGTSRPRAPHGARTCREPRAPTLDFYTLQTPCTATAPCTARGPASPRCLAGRATPAWPAPGVTAGPTEAVCSAGSPWFQWVLSWVQSGAGTPGRSHPRAVSHRGCAGSQTPPPGSTEDPPGPSTCSATLPFAASVPAAMPSPRMGTPPRSPDCSATAGRASPVSPGSPPLRHPATAGESRPRGPHRRRPRGSHRCHPRARSLATAPRYGEHRDEPGCPGSGGGMDRGAGAAGAGSSLCGGAAAATAAVPGRGWELRHGGGGVGGFPAPRPHIPPPSPATAGSDLEASVLAEDGGGGYF